MDEEIRAVLKNETFNLASKPKGLDPISYKWIYKLKRKTNGNVKRQRSPCY